MKAQAFVAAIHEVVLDATVKGMVSILERPPGRRPAADLVQLSEWYKGLSEHDKEMAGRLVGMAARHAVFRVFGVLDGTLKVDPAATANDYFELRHVHGGAEDILTGPKGEPLHELL